MLVDNVTEIERLETLLKRSKWEKDQLQQQLKAKDELIQTLNRQNASLEAAKNIFASSHLYPFQNSEALEQKINRLQKFLQEQAHQIDYLKQSISSHMQVTSTLQQTNFSNLIIMREKDMIIQTLRTKIKELQDINGIQQEQIERLNKNIHNYLAEKDKIIQANELRAFKLQQEEKEKQKKIKMLFEGLNVLTQEMNHKRTDKKQRSETEGNDEKLLLKIQHEELQERNQQILRLRSILDGMQVPMEESFLRNTIKHLRAELGKHNQRITSVLEKQQNAQQLIKKYTEIITKYQKEVQDIANLKNQNSQLKNKISELQIEIKQLNEKEQSEKKLRVETKELLVELLKENQCYHDMMYENYGLNYEFYIQNRKQDFKKRLEQRVKREKWASIEELISVNQKLRQRLKLI